MYTETTNTEYGTFATTQKYNTRGWGGIPEGFAQGFDNNLTTKALTFSNFAEFDFTASAELGSQKGISVITGNDSPERDPKDVLITLKDGTTKFAEFELTSERNAPINAYVNFDSQNVKSFKFTNKSGNITQWIELDLIPGDPTDPQEPPVDPPVEDLVPAIETVLLPNGKVGESYSQTIAVSSGNPPLTFTLSGNVSWLSIDSSLGELSGVPTVAGTYTFNVSVSDVDGDVDTADYTVVVEDAVTDPNPTPTLTNTIKVYSDGSVEVIPA